jgi:hypothetical protein
MKTNLLKAAGLLLITALFACSSNQSNNSASADSTNSDSSDMTLSSASYVRLDSGEPVTVVKDESGQYVYSDSRRPIEKDLMFVDVSTNDTLYGPKGVVVNNALIKSDAGSWSLNESMVDRNGEEITIKTADGKLKIDGDEMKYKEGDDVKTKVDGNESKSKSGDAKTKVDGNEMKTKSADTKVKVDD